MNDLEKLAMLRRWVPSVFSVLASMAVAASAAAQSGAFGGGGTYVPGRDAYTGVGRLSQPGQLNRGSPVNAFGRVGGTTTNTQVRTATSGGGGRLGPDRRATGGAGSGLPSPAGSRGTTSIPSISPQSRQKALNPVVRNNSIIGRTEKASRMGRPGSLSSFGGGISGGGLGLGSRRGQGTAGSGVGRGFGRAAAGSTGFTVARILDRQALIRPRTELAKAVSGPRGQQPAAELEPQGPNDLPAPEERFESLQDEPPPPTFEAKPEGTPLDRMLAKAQQSYEFYLVRGGEYMVSGDFPEAQSYFQAANRLQPEAAAPYVRMFMAAFYAQNNSQCGTFLYMALKRAKSVDDMRIDLDAMTPSKNQFISAVQRMAARTIGNEERPTHDFIYAYLAWIAGDREGATTVAKRLLRRDVEGVPGSGTLGAMLLEDLGAEPAGN